MARDAKDKEHAMSQHLNTAIAVIGSHDLEQTFASLVSGAG
jgi:hypothetical protein